MNERRDPNSGAIGHGRALQYNPKINVLVIEPEHHLVLGFAEDRKDIDTSLVIRRIADAIRLETERPDDDVAQIQQAPRPGWHGTDTLMRQFAHAGKAPLGYHFERIGPVGVGQRRVRQMRRNLDGVRVRRVDVKLMSYTPESRAARAPKSEAC